MMVSLRRAGALHIAKLGPACYCQGGFYKGMASMRFIPVPLHNKLNVDLLVIPSKHAYVGPTSANVGIGAATSPSGDDVGPTLFRRRLAMSQDDANPTSGDDVGSTLFRRRLATSPDDAKPTSGDDVGSTLFRRRLATSQYDAKPTSGDDVGSTLFPRR